MYALCDAGTVSDVCRRYHTVADSPGGGRMYEPESRMCRVGPEPAGCESVQPPGRAHDRSARGGVQHDDEAVLSGTKGEKEKMIIPFLKPVLRAGKSGRIPSQLPDKQL